MKRHEHEVGGAPGRPEAALDQEQEVPLVEDLRKRFRESWEENRRDGDPDVEFTFDLRPHARVSDAEGLAEVFSSADIVLLEGPGWRKEDLQYVRRIAQGEGPRPVRDIRIKPHQQSPKEFSAEKESALYGSGAYVAYVDTPVDDPSWKKFLEEFRTFHQESKEQQTYSAMVEKRRKFLDAFVDELRIREQHFAERIPEEIRHAFDERNDLAAKESVRVLLQMGTAHTPTSIAMKQEGQDVHRDFRERPVFAAGLEYIRARAFNSAAAASKEKLNALAARNAFEDVLSGILESHLEQSKATTRERDALLVRISQRFSVEELQALWEETQGFIPSGIHRELREKGFTFPKTHEELLEIIK